MTDARGHTDSKSADILAELIADAELAAGVAVRMSRLKSAEFLSALKHVNASAATGSAGLEAVVALQTSLNQVVTDLAPITLGDLRLGWSPLVSKQSKLPVVIFGLFAILLICVTAYMTLLYNRASFAH